MATLFKILYLARAFDFHEPVLRETVATFSDDCTLKGIWGFNDDQIIVRGPDGKEKGQLHIEGIRCVALTSAIHIAKFSGLSDVSMVACQMANKGWPFTLVQGQRIIRLETPQAVMASPYGPGAPIRGILGQRVPWACPSA